MFKSPDDHPSFGDIKVQTVFKEETGSVVWQVCRADNYLLQYFSTPYYTWRICKEFRTEVEAIKYAQAYKNFKTETIEV